MVVLFLVVLLGDGVAFCVLGTVTEVVVLGTCVVVVVDNVVGFVVVDEVVEDFVLTTVEETGRNVTLVEKTNRVANGEVVDDFVVVVSLCEVLEELDVSSGVVFPSLSPNELFPNSFSFISSTSLTELEFETSLPKNLLIESFSFSCFTPSFAKNDFVELWGELDAEEEVWVVVGGLMQIVVAAGVGDDVVDASLISLETVISVISDSGGALNVVELGVVEVPSETNDSLTSRSEVSFLLWVSDVLEFESSAREVLRFVKFCTSFCSVTKVSTVNNCTGSFKIDVGKEEAVMFSAGFVDDGSLRPISSTLLSESFSSESGNVKTAFQELNEEIGEEGEERKPDSVFKVGVIADVSKVGGSWVEVVIFSEISVAIKDVAPNWVTFRPKELVVFSFRFWKIRFSVYRNVWLTHWLNITWPRMLNFTKETFFYSFFVVWP